MDSINYQEDIAGNICRFCMLPSNEKNMLRIPWNEWQHSLLAAMYERIINKALFISKYCSELCCNKCSQLLSTTVATLDMFERSDTFWRAMVKVAPKSEYIEFSDHDHFANQSRQQKSSLIEIEFMKIESGDELDDIQSNTADKANDYESMVEVSDIMEIHQEKPNISEFKTADADIIKQSSKLVMDNDEPILCCVMCNELCRTRHMLSRHMKKAHCLKLCVRCDFLAPDSATLKRHDRAEHKPERSLDTISACTKCDKVCPDPVRLYYHMKNIHDPYVPSQCHICSKSFRSQMRLRLHVETHSEPTLKCDICSKMFRLKRHIVWHMKNTHIKNTNYFCSKCGKNYTEYTSFKTHENKTCPLLRDRISRQRTLTGNVSCSLCNRKFSALYVARRHYQQEHQIEDITTICCICNYLASSKDDLRNHKEEIHIDIRCPICKRFCVTEINLKLHIATHSAKEHEFKCSICEAEFLKLPDLKLHYSHVHTCSSSRSRNKRLT